MRASITVGSLRGRNSPRRLKAAGKNQISITAIQSIAPPLDCGSICSRFLDREVQRHVKLCEAEATVFPLLANSARSGAPLVNGDRVQFIQD